MTTWHFGWEHEGIIPETEILGEVTMEKERHSTKAAMKCAEWLALCLKIGWEKKQLNALEKIWWEYHDNRGKIKKL